jgi:hypothetical protein
LEVDPKLHETIVAWRENPGGPDHTMAAIKLMTMISAVIMAMTPSRA